MIDNHGLGYLPYLHTTNLVYVFKNAFHNIPMISVRYQLVLTNNSNYKREVRPKFPDQSSRTFWVK